MRYIRWFSELGIKDIPLVGGKNASLGELGHLLKEHAISMPNGFALTAEAYRDLLNFNQLSQPIAAELDKLQPDDPHSLQRVGKQIRHWLCNASLPPELIAELTQAYRSLEQQYGADTDVAVRSSATAEDLPGASFAGQQDTLLNIRGMEQLHDACLEIFASLFTDRAINYRIDQGFEHMSVALSIGVQKMVRSDLACSGVMFTLDTESGFRDLVLINAAYGLGENVVQGTVNPDEFLVFKPTLKDNLRPIVRRQLGDKAHKLIYASGGRTTENIAVEPAEQAQFALTDSEVLALARCAVEIEQHYGRPMDLEWAKDGESGRLFILQARPETVHSQEQQLVQETYSLQQRSEILASGRSVGKQIASGPARLVASADQLHVVQAGDVLVTDITDPDWEPAMKKASAIVTNRGGRVCHAAIIARELGLPAVVGTRDATTKITDGQWVTVSCAEGDTGFIYDGELPFERREQALQINEKPRTKLMMNVADPSRAFTAAALPNDGVGLARLEFIINHLIGIHPRAALEFANQSADVQLQIAQHTRGYPDPVSFYVARMAEGIGAIAAAFYPKPVILRFSDFKSNEYSSLIGGKGYEPHEENPMLGFRGAGRYPSAEFADCFALECHAVKQVREHMGLDNLALMIPFTRTTADLDQVLDVMAEHGLKRGEHGLKLYTMCEIPANVILADAFLDRCDGFSIGSNDLTQLTLGVDRDSGLLTQYDERDEAVKKLIAMAIEACNRRGKYIGICGQAPSDFPEITRWLVEQGIGSISLNPDSVLDMTEVVLGIEKELQQR